jgi:hypothetical protein
MKSYWILCPLDIKEKIQHYLKHIMQLELLTHWEDVNYETYGECETCLHRIG